MSYTIKVRVYQTDVKTWFYDVERTNWHYANGGTWTEANDELTLSMGGSGTSGTLRFQNEAGERFTVALGVHNYVRWCDIVTNLAKDQTGLVINPQYYDNKYPNRQRAREAQLAEYSVSNAQGRKITVKYTTVDTQNLKAVIIIG